MADKNSIPVFRKPLYDLVGCRFGRWVVIAPHRIEGVHHTKWVCLCDCGTFKTVYGSSLKGGKHKSRSCGCLVLDTRAAKKLANPANVNGKPSKTYYIWRGAKSRCLSPSSSGYKYYGGKGIGISDSWMTYTNFLADMGEAPAGLSLDRVDAKGDYCVENCRWADNHTQSRNRTNNVWIDTPDGKMISVDAAKKYGISHSAFMKRVKKGWPMDSLITPPDPRFIREQSSRTR